MDKKQDRYHQAQIDNKRFFELNMYVSKTN